MSQSASALPAALHRRIDIRFFPKNCYWLGILYFTGPQELNVRMRQEGTTAGPLACIADASLYAFPPCWCFWWTALDKGMTLSEYCVCAPSGTPLVVNCEEDVFEHLGMPFMPPHERF